MGQLTKRRTFGATLSIVIAAALMAGLSSHSSAETETATIQPGMYLALFFDLYEGNDLQFEVTSNVGVYVGVLDSANYNSYSTSGDFSSTLYISPSASTKIEGSVEVPSDGRYYLIVENSASSLAASVTVDYDVKGDGITLSGLASAAIVGGIIGAAAAVAGAMVYRRRRAKSKEVPPAQQTERIQEMPPMPPSPPPT